MKKIVGAIALGAMCFQANAQDFDTYFQDRTLRVDYIFSGNAHKQEICLDELSALTTWAGRRHHLAEIPLAGNGEICMKDQESGEVIYRTSFSSLFQEWIGEPEAKALKRGFENTFLLPFPKKKAIVNVVLKGADHGVTAQLMHEIDPADILIHQRNTKEVTPHKYLHKSGELEDCIDIAILAEGYTAEEMEVFYQDAQNTCDALFSHEPYKSMKDRFNIVAVASESKDSGVSIPRESQWKTTAVHSHFDTFYSDRYLTTRSVKAIHNWLSGIPYEHIIILANTDTYGGGGIYNAYTLTTAHHSTFKPVVVHEFGHSFGGLADEYAYTDEPCPLYPYNVEPWEPNITTLVHFDEKWQDMVPEGTKIPTETVTTPENQCTTVGVFEGAGYTKKGIYRPATDCRMKTNEAVGFCPVCQCALQRMIRFYTEK